MIWLCQGYCIETKSVCITSSVRVRLTRVGFDDWGSKEGGEWKERLLPITPALLLSFPCFFLSAMRMYCFVPLLWQVPIEIRRIKLVMTKPKWPWLQIWRLPVLLPGYTFVLRFTSPEPLWQMVWALCDWFNSLYRDYKAHKDSLDSWFFLTFVSTEQELIMILFPWQLLQLQSYFNIN